MEFLGVFVYVLILNECLDDNDLVSWVCGGLASYYWSVKEI